ncbi:hypothetical protein HYH03_014395 [Edaphochlamys debaryana]|uniref:Apple domain-containing protein n=1 Tax=Edaphochlamys debaryana TaxID=47281 RepID=A0A835XUA4_9CHLO|nr:hypothetical protein HYH03_014395 [Edaphochlamys debaryana]|eukprot:KAG2487025.1 hypothetical protein HYH03_014395 [Edaphochlamys debaryana]
MSANYGSFHCIPGWGIAGGDVAPGSLADSQDACRDKCLATAGCEFFVYVPGPQECYAKNNMFLGGGGQTGADPTRNPTVCIRLNDADTSGESLPLGAAWSQCMLQDDCQGFTDQGFLLPASAASNPLVSAERCLYTKMPYGSFHCIAGWGIAGGDVAPGSLEDSQDACRDKCLATAGCEFFVYVPGPQECYTKNNMFLGGGGQTGAEPERNPTVCIRLNDAGPVYHRLALLSDPSLCLAAVFDLSPVSTASFPGALFDILPRQRRDLALDIMWGLGGSGVWANLFTASSAASQAFSLPGFIPAA